MIIEELIDSKNEIWNRFLLQSKNANIFSHSFYDDLNQDYDIKELTKNKKIKEDSFLKKIIKMIK